MQEKLRPITLMEELFFQNNFYVDDLIKLVTNKDMAVQLIKVTGMCHEGGFNMTKFTSKRKRVLQSIPEKDRRPGVKDKDLVIDLPEDQVLGVFWNIEDDAFGFKVALKSKPMTRRGVLSVLCLVYDPFGFEAPFLLKGKQILQKLCEQGLKWDEELPKETDVEWIKWKDRLSDLESVLMKRCFIPPTFVKIKDCSLHYFSDACEKGYGQVIYLRAVDEKGRVHCSLVMGKARVAPLKYITIPRMELVAATLSVKISVMLQKEFQIPITRETFWTDSEAVLGYIRNQARKFKVFVANRVEVMRENSHDSQWFHVNTKANPADYCSRGIDVNNTKATETWFNGPSFLWESESTSASNRRFFDVSSDDPELKKELRTNYTEVAFDILHQLEEKISTWDRMKRVMS